MPTSTSATQPPSDAGAELSPETSAASPTVATVITRPISTRTSLIAPCTPTAVIFPSAFGPRAQQFLPGEPATSCVRLAQPRVGAWAAGGSRAKWSCAPDAPSGRGRRLRSRPACRPRVRAVRSRQGSPPIRRSADRSAGFDPPLDRGRPVARRAAAHRLARRVRAGGRKLLAAGLAFGAVASAAVASPLLERTGVDLATTNCCSSSSKRSFKRRPRSLRELGLAAAALARVLPPGNRVGTLTIGRPMRCARLRGRSLRNRNPARSQRAGRR